MELKEAVRNYNTSFLKKKLTSLFKPSIEEINDGFLEAISCNYTEIVKLFLKHNADVNMLQKDGRTALMRASRSGNTELVKLLLDHNADVNIQQNDDWPALMLACQKNTGYTEIV